ncbi:MAG: hypothetical protein M3Y80_11700 [Verrucomicrobiota bacterium]|nr:hypothetical protein [Verrucomicrobiota bacterium]
MIKRVLVRCPSTAKLTPTGQTVEEEAWGKTKLKQQKVLCPHCNEKHAWTKEDVVLAR